MTSRKNESTKLLTYGIGFIIFCSSLLFIIEKSLSFFVSNSSDGQTGKINLIMNHIADPEILILGSSVAEVGFNSNLIAKKTNKIVYNTAIDGTTVIQSEFIIDEFLSYSKRCKQIVIGLAFFSFSQKNSMTEPSRYLAHFTSPNVKASMKEVSPSLYFKLQYVPFYTFTQVKHTYYKNAFQGLRNYIQGAKLLPDQLNGFVPHDVSWNGDRVNKNDYELGHINISENTVESYIQIIEKIKEQGVEPILVITPMFIEGQKLFGNYEEYISTAKDICSKTNIRFIDFSKNDIVNHEKYYYNNGHLNSTGADVFSKQFVDSLKKK